MFFDGSQGNYHDLSCSVYSESPVLGSCYVEQLGIYYSGYALNITQVVLCPLDSMALLLFLASSVLGFIAIRKRLGLSKN